jgi:hypothetical protein
MSRVQPVWHQYLTRLQQAEQQARATPRLPGAVGVVLSDAVVCARRASLRALRVPAAAPSAAALASMQAGVQAEERLALLLEAHGWHLARQVPVQTPYGNGRIDLVVHQPHRLLLEIKTVALTSLPYLPRPEHVDQLLLYMGYYPADTPWEGELVYWLRSETQPDQLKAFAVAWDAARFAQLTDRLALIAQYVQQEQAVPLTACPEMQAHRPPCRYSAANRCAYWAHCWQPAAAPDAPADDWQEL